MSQQVGRNTGVFLAKTLSAKESKRFTKAFGVSSGPQTFPLRRTGKKNKRGTCISKGAQAKC